MVLISLLIILVAFFYLQKPKNQLFVPADSEMFLASKNSKLEKFFDLDKDFVNLTGQKFFYVWSWKKVYWQTNWNQNKIFWSTGFFEYEKLQDYNIQKNLKNFENWASDWFFVKNIFSQKVFGFSSWSKIEIFLVWKWSWQAIFSRPNESDFFFAWWNIYDFEISKKLEIFFESEYFSWLKVTEKTNMKKFFTAAWAINIFWSGWELVSNYTWDTNFLTKLESIWLTWNFFSWETLNKKILFWNKNFDFGVQTWNSSKIFVSKRFSPYVVSWQSKFEYWYQKFDLILE